MGRIQSQRFELKEFDSFKAMFEEHLKGNTFETFRQSWWKAKKKMKEEVVVAIDAIPLAVKSPSIVGWKIHKEGRKSYYQITRADGKSQIPVEDLNLLLWGDLKTMFESRIEDKVWRNQQDYKVLNWKLYDSCGVHSLMMQHVHIYMLVEKTYPLIPSTLSMILEKKLMIDYESEMAYQFLKLIMKQLKKIVKIKSLFDAVRIVAAHVCVNADQLDLETDIQEKDKKKAKNRQNQARNGKDKVKSKTKSAKVRKSTPTKSKVNQVKKIQLEGLKLPNLKLYYENKRQGLKLHTG
ncbi:hypothetical protein Tco_0679045 [Tanacetum coccineum]|uniref:Transposase n=1 Tax=Tanacetum coccineum TaxID=301880 RepID=A0ABQ4XGS9_9ASTR